VQRDIETGRSAEMKKRLAIVLAIAVVALAGATFAIGGGTGIWDDNHFAKPGSLDDGKDLLPLTTITLSQANAAAQRAASGSLGQVDLERFEGRVVYKVDVGPSEVRVDAADGRVVSIGPQS
jgi:uncharacterized membrane protein YkoI